ncbi:MAG: hypothetical protein LBP58_01590, partial [Azoarcus sp.]|nr:hypothetical protein [Azoarcus sp.]
EQTLTDYLLAYNHFIPQQAIGHRAPIDALESWYNQHPDLFIAPVRGKDHNQAERDTYAFRAVAGFLLQRQEPGL